MKESIVRRTDGNVGINTEIYQFDLGGNSREELLKFKGEVQIDLTFAKAIKLLQITAQKIVT